MTAGRDSAFFAFIREAQERAASGEPQQPTLADRLRQLREESGDDRRERIEALAVHGATEGEREAARAALLRMDEADERERRDVEALRDEDDYLDARQAGEA